MYEWLKKTFSNINNVIFCVVLLVLLLWSVITNVRLYSTQRNLRRTEQRFNDLRTELESAQDRERELTETVDNIRGITGRTDQILSQSTGTIQGIREKIQILENYFDSINQYFGANDYNNDNNIDSKE